MYEMLTGAFCINNNNDDDGARGLTKRIHRSIGRESAVCERGGSGDV